MLKKVGFAVSPMVRKVMERRESPIRSPEGQALQAGATRAKGLLWETDGYGQ